MLDQVLVGIICVVIAILAWFLGPPWLERRTQDPIDWWEERMTRCSLEEAEVMADDYRDLANRLRKVRDMEVARDLAEKLEERARLDCMERLGMLEGEEL